MAVPAGSVVVVMMVRAGCHKGVTKSSFALDSGAKSNGILPQDRRVLSMLVLKNLDLLLLGLALPLFLVADLPLLGWVVAAVIWLLWRGIGEWSDRRAASATTPKAMAGIAAGSMIGRGWLLGLILLGAGLAAGDDVGLSAAVLSLVLFTVYFTLKMLLGSPESKGPATT